MLATIRVGHGLHRGGSGGLAEGTSMFSGTAFAHAGNPARYTDLRGQIIDLFTREIPQQDLLAAVFQRDTKLVLRPHSPARAVPVSTKGGLRPAERFRFELEDPVVGRALRHEYTVRPLPIVG